MYRYVKDKQAAIMVLQQQQQQQQQPQRQRQRQQQQQGSETWRQQPGSQQRTNKHEKPEQQKHSANMCQHCCDFARLQKLVREPMEAAGPAIL